VAVDFIHRLLIIGRTDRTRSLRRSLYREFERCVGGKSWTEIIPFSFEALYELAPRATRIEADIPCDPYDIAAWPVRKLPDGRAEARYQFQTRNLEMAGLVGSLARTLPRLTFLLVTFCLDDSSIESYRFSAGTCRKWMMSERRIEGYWARARAKFRLAGDEVYEDEDAEQWVEEQMLKDALGHWARRRKAGLRRYRWWNRPRFHDVASERTIFMYEMAESVGAEGAVQQILKRRQSK